MGSVRGLLDLEARAAVLRGLTRRKAFEDSRHAVGNTIGALDECCTVQHDDHMTNCTASSARCFHRRRVCRAANLCDEVNVYGWRLLALRCSS